MEKVFAKNNNSVFNLLNTKEYGKTNSNLCLLLILVGQICTFPCSTQQNE